MKYSILTIGDCVKDIFILAPSEILTTGRAFGRSKKYLSFPYGEKLPIKEVNYDLGGSACNAGVAFARLGINTAFAGVIGGESFSREALDILKKEKLATRFVRVAKNEETDFSVILTGPTGDRTILVYRAENDFSKLNIKKALNSSEAIYLAGMDQHSKLLAKDILDHIKKTKKPLYLNPSSSQLYHDRVMLKKLLSQTTIVALNMTEALLLVGRQKMKIRDLLINIKKMGPESVIITYGEKGSFFYDGKIFYKIGIYSKPKKDSAGSGDCFFATFIASRMRGRRVEDALRLAAANAAEVVGVFGAQRGLSRWNTLIATKHYEKVKIKKI